MFLVVGATGMVGSIICRRLAEEGASVRGLVRESSDPEKVRTLTELGVETVVGDLRDRASLDRACQGATAIIETAAAMPFTFQPGVNDIETTDLAGVAQLLEAAKGAGVDHAVYMSFSGNLDLDFPLRNAKRVTEARFRDSGMTWTVLRPSFFMEVWLGPAVGFDAGAAKATIYGPGTAPISWIAVADVAEFAVRALDEPSARNAILELGGPEAVTPLEAVRIFEAAGGRPFQVEHVSVEALVAQQAAAPDDMGRSFSGLMRCYAQGDAIPMAATARRFGVELTSVADFARNAYAATAPSVVG